MGLLTKIFGTYSDHELKKIYPIADKIEALEEEYKALTDAQLQAKTAEFKERLQNGETTDDILPEAFATVREAADRVLGLRPYRVQLIGGIVLHQGRIAEMKTGEGKTLVATLPAYLNALTGQGVHIVTVNDYLAKRDSEWMGKVHRFLGLSVGLIIHDLSKAERQAAYAADITYGTNNEMGFDYLRDNMALYASEQVQRGHHFAIVDEVDSILIDEARTPLIISGMGEKSTQLYDQAEQFAARLKKYVVTETDDKAEEDPTIDADYVVDEKAKTATLTAEAYGLDHCAVVTLREDCCLGCACVKMNDKNVLIRQCCCVLVFDSQVPQLDKRRVACVQLARVKALRDDGLLHGGSCSAEDILTGILLPVVLHAGICDALAERRPDRRRRLAGIQVCDQQFAVNGLASSGIKGHVCHN